MLTPGRPCAGLSASSLDQGRVSHFTGSLWVHLRPAALKICRLCLEGWHQKVICGAVSRSFSTRPGDGTGIPVSAVRPAGESVRLE